MTNIFDWINEPEGLWFGRAELMMNSLRKKVVARFRQGINEPAAQKFGVGQ